MSRRIYRMTRKPSGPEGAYETFTIIVPSDIGAILKERDINTFVCELTEDGILYRPIDIPLEETKNLPTWLRRDSNGR